MSRRASLGAFWGSLGYLGAATFGYPLLVAVRTALCRRPVRSGDATPFVSMIVAAHNEESVIRAKIENALALDYPSDRLEIVIALDGCTDDTAKAVRGVGSERVRLLELPRSGKNLALGQAVDAARGAVLVFSDADAHLAPDAVRALVAPFADPTIGGCGGLFRYTRDGQGMDGERAYWSVETALRRLASASGSITSCDGRLYAVRRELFDPPPPGASDDFVISAAVPEAGRRLVFVEGARAWGPPAAETGSEFRRKVRVIRLGLRGVWVRRRALDPRRTGSYALQMAFQKIFRRSVALPVVALAVVTPGLARRGGIYGVAAAVQVVFHGAALAGLVISRRGQRPPRPLGVPMYVDMVNAASIVAFTQVVTGRGADVWTPDREVRTCP